MQCQGSYGQEKSGFQVLEVRKNTLLGKVRKKSGKLGKGQEKVRIFIFEITFLNFETQLATVHINSSAIYLAVT